MVSIQLAKDNSRDIFKTLKTFKSAELNWFYGRNYLVQRIRKDISFYGTLSGCFWPFGYLVLAL